MRVLVALAVADFRERTRRLAYAVVLLAAVGLAWLAVPDPEGRWVIMNIGTYRGVYTSAYVGAVTALAGALWFLIGGFYVVRGAIPRDEQTRVGHLLATTPLSRTGYLAGKFLSNLMVLASMTAVLAVTAVVLQLLRGESRTLNPVDLVAPFVVLTFPVLAITSAAALWFDTTSRLRAGLGNIIWFFVALPAATAAQVTHAPLGGLGTSYVADSMYAAMTAQGLALDGAEFSVGLMYLDHPPTTFHWPGLEITGGMLLERMGMVLLACVLALVPAAWFGRFDPARTRYQEAAQPASSSPAGAAGPAGLPTPGGSPVLIDPGTGLALDMPQQAPSQSASFQGRPRTVPVPGWRTGRLITGELRILLKSASPWWWAGAATIAVTGLAVPVDNVPGALLAAWIWPILLWSRLGAQRVVDGVDTLLDAYPGVRPQLVAEWMAGVVLSMLTGAAPLLRFLIAQDGAGVAAWLDGALVIPSLALALGALSRGPRLFQIAYLSVWYLVVNGIAAFDYLGAVRHDGRLAGPHPLIIISLAGVLLAGALLIRTLRHVYR